MLYISSTSMKMMAGMGGFHRTSIQLFQVTADKETSFIWMVNSDVIMFIRILVFLYSYPIYHTDVLSLKWEFTTGFLGKMVVLTNSYVPSFHSGHTLTIFLAVRWGHGMWMEIWMGLLFTMSSKTFPLRIFKFSLCWLAEEHAIEDLRH